MAEDDASDGPGGITRRDFFRSGALGALGSGLLGAGLEAAEAPALARSGPGRVAMTFSVNGRPLQASLEPRVTLLDALRDQFELTGAKKVCDRGSCGACTVLLDGRPIYSCSLLAIEAQEGEIRTIEGLGTPDKLHPLQAAFVKNDALQCGYCTPGFVMACSAFLAGNPQPTRAQVEQGLCGNLCRCGTYDGIRAAVLEAAGKAGSRG